VPGWAVLRLDDAPTIREEDAPEWVPLQHLFGLTAFGANAFRATSPGDELIAEHDETGSGQEELYVVIAGRATFTLDGEELDAPAVSAVAIREAAVVRSAAGAEAGTVLLALGGLPRDDFRSTWRAEHFDGIDPIL
jgi:hypothetical protein